jgi:hypothetical protein
VLSSQHLALLEKRIDFRPIAEVVAYNVHGSALLDTGCLCRDVIDTKFYHNIVANNLKAQLPPPQLHPTTSSVKMADQTTSATVSGTVTLSLRLKFQTHSVTVTQTFLVMTCAYPIIIGLKTLCSDTVFPFFLKVLQHCRDAVMTAPTLAALRDAPTHAQSVLYPDLRQLNIQTVNQVFRDHKAFGMYKVEIVQDDFGGWSLRALVDIKIDSLICLFSNVLLPHGSPCNLIYAAQMPNGVYDTPPPNTYAYGMLMNDALSDRGNNTKLVVQRVDKTLCVSSLRYIRRGEDVCLAFGAAAWATQLPMIEPYLSRQNYHSLRAKVSDYYGPSLVLNIEFEPVDFNPIAGELYEPFLHMPESAPEEDMFEDAPFIPPEVIYAFTEEYPTRLAEYESTVMDYVSVDMKTQCPEFYDFMMQDWVKDVFVVENWTGILHPDTGKEYEQTLEWLSIPPRRKAKTHPVRPKLAEPVYKEIRALVSMGFWTIDDSDSASALVIADKATEPFVRCVADYSPLTRHLALPKYPLKNVRCSLNFIKDGFEGKPFTHFCDLDMTASFHQIRIDEASSRLLSLVTPLGQYRPRFLPEGISPATAVLQKVVETVFHSCRAFMLIIYDNFLVCGTSMANVYANLQTVLRQAKKCNVRLKLKKCKFGVQEIQFFGYKCNAKGYTLDQERIFKTNQIPFPGDPPDSSNGKKATRLSSYLGVGIFFAPFVKDYARATASLNDMTVKNFNWDEKTWTTDFRALFEEHKKRLLTVLTLFYPDYDLPWVLETDASDIGCGAILYQITDAGEKQPLALVGYKFSGPARSWHIQDKECFAIYYAFAKLHYITRGKWVEVHSDARNLRYMETSNNKRVYRYYLALATQPFGVRHIKGVDNPIADWISRLYEGESPATIEAARQTLICALALEEQFGSYSLSEIIYNLSEVHGGKAGHHGVYRTWMLLNKIFPGHPYSVKDVRQAIEDCPVCQKLRADRDCSLVPLTKTIRSTHARNLLCCDLVSFFMGTAGFIYILVLVNHFTKHMHLFRVKDKKVRTTAACIIQYYSIYGVCDILHSDPGSDYTATELRQVVSEWLGVTRTFSLTGNPQADGVEPSIKKVIRHLTALLMDENLHSDWDNEDGVYVSLVQLVCNESIPYDTKVSPFEAMYGFIDSEKFRIPDAAKATCDGTYVLAISRQLAAIREASQAYQAKNRLLRESPPDFIQCRYKPGDFVMVVRDKWTKLDKLTPRGEGPYQVVLHPLGSNHVQTTSLHNGDPYTFDCKDLNIFTGSDEDARAMAKLDKQQHDLTAIVGHTGDVLVRTKMEFCLLFADGDRRWQMYNRDVFTTAAFHAYCQSSRLLQLLLLTASEALTAQRPFKTAVISPALQNTTFFLDLRYFGSAWYASLENLPDRYTTTYYISGRYESLVDSKHIWMTIPLYHTRDKATGYFVQYHGYVTAAVKPAVVITDHAMLVAYGLT